MTKQTETATPPPTTTAADQDSGNEEKNSSPQPGTVLKDISLKAAPPDGEQVVKWWEARRGVDIWHKDRKILVSLIDRAIHEAKTAEPSSSAQAAPRCFLVEHKLPNGGMWMEVFSQEENAQGYAQDREAELHVTATVTPLYAISKHTAGEVEAAQCHVTCAAFPLSGCKESHQCVLDKGHSFDPMYGEIHRFVTHMMPVRPRPEGRNE